MLSDSESRVVQLEILFRPKNCVEVHNTEKENVESAEDGEGE